MANKNMIEINSLNARIWSKLGQRGTFGISMKELGKSVENLMVLTADLCNTSGLSQFQKTSPDKFLNVGIAEQNLIGIAAGLAKEGKNVFATSFSTFAAMRSYEQIRIYLGYMELNVKVVGLAGGLAMGMFGPTHYGYEDLALMRAVPGLTVLSPADGTEVVKTMLALINFKGPVFVRLSGAMNNPIVYKNDYEFEIGKAITLRQGNDVAIIATGTMVFESLAAANILAENGISATVVNMHTIKPLDISVISKVCEDLRLIITVEEHGIVGGLGGAVAEYKSTLKESPSQLFIGLPDKFDKAGEYKYLLEKHGLTAKQIAEKIIKEYGNLRC
jgi:transketolase